MSKLVLAIDVGTSSTRAALVDEHLNIIASGSRKNALLTPKPGYAEQDPEDLLQSVYVAIQTCMDKAPPDTKPNVVSIDTAMHSLVALDKNGQPLTPLYIWADTRAKTEAEAVANSTNAHDLYQRTGCPQHASYLPYKIRWLKQEHFAIFDKTHTFASLKGYLLRHLTDTSDIIEDLASASGSGLLNMKNLTWDEKALDIAGISITNPSATHTPSQLPRLVEPTAVVGTSQSKITSIWGGDVIPVIAGGTDGPLANVGAGSVNSNQMVVTIGTSAAVRMITDKPQVDPNGSTWCYYVSDGAWVIGGALNAGGTSVDWLANAFPETFKAHDTENRHRLVERMVSDTPIGADGLLFAPYLTGERSPGWNENTRGFIVGANTHHTAAHFARAVLEGVCLQIAWVVESVVQAAGDPREIRITGGFVSSGVWPQMLADVLGRKLVIPSNQEGTLIGTALLGLSAVDDTFDWRTQAKMITIERTIEPDQKAHARYKPMLKLYKNVYRALMPHFDDIVGI